MHWVWTRLSKLLRRTRDRLNFKRPGQNKRITIAQTQLGRRFSWVSSCFTVSQVRCSCATKATIVRSWPDGRNIVSKHIKSYQIITRILSLYVSVVLEIGWKLSKKHSCGNVVAWGESSSPSALTIVAVPPGAQCRQYKYSLILILKSETYKKI